MKATLQEIIGHLGQRNYKNEEHVRVAIVYRILEKLGWNIWNPEEVHPEFATMRNEDTNRVDIAVFQPPLYKKPALFIEVKAVGKLESKLEESEKQLRDYTRDNQAEIAVLTDGQIWHFYLPSASGEFSQKRFETLDFKTTDASLEDIELALASFLSKEALKSSEDLLVSSAVKEAQSYLRRTEKEQTMLDMLTKANRERDDNITIPFLSLFIRLCSERGVRCTEEQAQFFIREQNNSTKQTPSSTIKSQLQTIKLPLQNKTAKQHSQPLGSNKDLYLKGKRGAEARGKSLGGSFLVYANSYCSEGTGGRGDQSDLRKQLERQKKLIPEIRNGMKVYRLTENYEFNSPSEAASLLLGCSASGPREWK